MTRKGTIAKAILATLAVSGIVAVGAMAPNAIQALTFFGIGKSRQRNNQRYYINTVINRLARQGLIKFQKSAGGKTYLKITESGRGRLLKYQTGELELKRPRRWDGRWRVLIFDIREYRRGDRDQLRIELERFGFKRLQNSVWVFPYDCEELVLLLKSSFGFGKELLFMTVEKIENDRWLRQCFDLS